MTVSSSRPLGQRYEKVYPRKSALSTDISSLRTRLCAYLRHHLGGLGSRIFLVLQRELGNQVPNKYGMPGIVEFFEHARPEKIFSGITIVRDAIWDSTGDERRTASLMKKVESWIAFCQRAFDEEQVAWEVDDFGGVHPRMDYGLATRRSAAVSGIDLPQFDQARQLIEQCYRRLGEHPPSTRDAIGNIFAAVESLYKLIVNSSPGSTLNAPSARQKLTPILIELYKDDAVQLSSAKALLESLCEWLPAAHGYRHGQKEGSANPPVGLAAPIISGGVVWAQWLAGISNALAKVK